jgi:tRNA G18 (ribose-2'-O)-methylase SpoU
MNIIPVSDPLDERLDPYRDIKLEDVRRRGKYFIAEGKLVAERLLASDYETVSVLAEPARAAWLEGIIRPETPVLLAPAELIRQVAGFNFHRGLLACGRRMPLAPSDGLFTHTAPGTVALAAIAINDLENLGSLIRTSAAMGINHVVLSRQSVDPLCRRVLRVSMGAALKMRYFDLDDPVGWLQENQRRGHWFTIATTLSDDSIPIRNVKDHPDFAARRRMILMGNEGDGLPAAIQAVCTVRAKIPMARGIDSLNVAVAGAIAIYELMQSPASELSL